MMAQADAVSAVLDKIAPKSCPTLSDDTIRRLVEASKRASVWSASTAFGFGETVVPTIGNGRRYTCAQGGISGATEPIWPRQYPGEVWSSGFRHPRRVFDGTVIWLDAGPAHREIYDVRRAIKACWEAKAAIASDETDFKAAGGDSFSREAIYQHCVGQAARYGSADIG